MINEYQIYKSKLPSKTTGEHYFVKVICKNVEWVDNPNCPKDGNAKPLEVVLQRVKKADKSGVGFKGKTAFNLKWQDWVLDDTRPFAIFQDNFNELYEEINE